jgi:hypothetical protein
MNNRDEWNMANGKHSEFTPLQTLALSNNPLSRVGGWLGGRGEEVVTLILRAWEWR